MKDTMRRGALHARAVRAALALMLLSVSATGLAAAGSQDADINGVWQTKTGGYVQIYKDGPAYDGRIVGSVDGKARYDKNNPNPKEKGRRLLGVVVLNHLKPEGNGQYDGGTIYDPNNGKTYSAKADLKNHDTLGVRGYIGVSLLGKTQTWHRIDRNAAHVHSDLLH